MESVCTFVDAMLRAWVTLKRLVRSLPYCRTKLFDSEYYRSSNREVLLARIIPWAHFVAVGAYQGRSPHPLFDLSLIHI